MPAGAIEAEWWEWCQRGAHGAESLGAGGLLGGWAAYQHVALVHGSKRVPGGEGGMGNDGSEEAALDVLDALAASMAVVDSKQADKIAGLDLLDASGVVVFHVPSAPEGEAVSPLNLDLWAAHRGVCVASVNTGRAGWLRNVRS